MAEQAKSSTYDVGGRAGPYRPRRRQRGDGPPPTTQVRIEQGLYERLAARAEEHGHSISRELDDLLRSALEPAAD